MARKPLKGHISLNEAYDINEDIDQIFDNVDLFVEKGFELVTGGTDNHLFLIDLSNTHPSVTGHQVQEACDEKGITLNKNCVPNENRSPKEASGLRIGLAAMTTKGATKQEIRKWVHEISNIIDACERENFKVI